MQTGTVPTPIALILASGLFLLTGVLSDYTPGLRAGAARLPTA